MESIDFIEAITRSIGLVATRLAEAANVDLRMT